MEKYLDTLKCVPLFGGLSDDEILCALDHISAKIRICHDDEVIMQVGEKAEWLGIVLNGEVHIVSEDFYGNRNIIANVCSGEMFGEAFACAGTLSLPVSVYSHGYSEIILADCKKIIDVSSSGGSFHGKMAFNMITVLARKNILLNSKIGFITKRTTREKLLAYLSSMALKNNSGEFDIPFDRQQLADFLSVDRSAMSAELCKLRDDGLIKFHKSHFTVFSGNNT